MQSSECEQPSTTVKPSSEPPGTGGAVPTARPPCGSRALAESWGAPGRPTSWCLVADPQHAVLFIPIGCHAHGGAGRERGFSPVERLERKLLKMLVTIESLPTGLGKHLGSSTHLPPSPTTSFLCPPGEAGVGAEGTSLPRVPAQDTRALRPSPRGKTKCCLSSSAAVCHSRSW